MFKKDSCLHTWPSYDKTFFYGEKLDNVNIITLPLLLLLACEYPGSLGSATFIEQRVALNSGYMLAIDGDCRIMCEMIRLGV